MYPKISIITVVYNDELHIEETIESVIRQTYEHIEYIIVDGASTDKTLTKIKKHGSKVDIILSEPDNGIYDAMNKGIALASGDWLLFLNSGDVFKDRKVLEKISNYLLKDDLDIVYGDVEVYSEENNIKYKIHARPVQKIKLRMVANHQSFFIRRDLHLRYLYDLKYRIASDYHFIYKCFLMGSKIIQIPETISVVSAGGVSDVSRFNTFKEIRQIKNEFHPSIQNQLYFIKQASYHFFVNSVKKLFPDFSVKLYKMKVNNKNLNL